MNAAVILRPEQRWECPNCVTRVVTHEARVHTEFHTCRATGMWQPMVPAGTRCKVELVERGDYVGDEHVQLDPLNGRPVMSVVVTRDDGTDCAIYAPMAIGDRG
jgi:hypothetical protein